MQIATLRADGKEISVDRSLGQGFGAGAVERGFSWYAGI
jgi:hypothetical protein